MATTYKSPFTGQQVDDAVGGYTTLKTQVAALEETKDTQAKEIAALTTKSGQHDTKLSELETGLDTVSGQAQTNKEDIEALKGMLEETKDYYVAENDDVTGSPKFQNGQGNKEFLADWHFYLVDTTDNAGKVTHPVGQLMDNNIFRFANGSFAPSVGITEAQRAACDVQLYTDTAHTQKLTLRNGVEVTDKDGAHPYDAAEVYNSLGIVTLYDAEGNKVRQLLPWETTETKYTIVLGRMDTLYPVDRQTGKSGAVLSGIFRKAVTYDGINTGKYPLAPTGMAPCPCTTVGNKTRNFFYDYGVGDTNTTNGNGNYNLCSMFVDGRTYPRISDMNQPNDMKFARANNADANAPYPFAEGGYHALNTYTLCMELLYGTKYLHDNALFGSGISSNDACNSEATWTDNGGVRIKEKGTADWGYYPFSAQTPFGVDTTLKKANVSEWLNYYRPKEQCMESQMAASWATEMGIAENTEYEAYGATYLYKNIPGAKTLADGKMNCKVLRTKTGTGEGYKDAETKATYEVECRLRMSLIGGMNLSGDIFAYWGGGCEMVGTNKKQTTGSHDEDQLKLNSVDFYLEPNQEKWETETTITKENLGTFPFEGKYSKVGTFGPPILSDGYAKTRLGFTPYKTALGGGLSSWQCYYTWAFPYWSSKLNTRTRISVRFRGSSNIAVCSARYLAANGSASAADVGNGGSAQCLLG